MERIGLLQAMHWALGSGLSCAFLQVAFPAALVLASSFSQGGGCGPHRQRPVAALLKTHLLFFAFGPEYLVREETW